MIFANVQSMNRLLKSLIAIALAMSGVVSTGSNSHAITASGYQVSAGSISEVYGDYLLNVSVANSSAPGNLANCSITIGFYSGSAKMATQETSFSKYWIPAGETKNVKVRVTSAVASYAARVEAATCSTSPERYLVNNGYENNGYEFVPSDQSQLEFAIVQTTRGKALQIINKSSSPLYTRFEITFNFNVVVDDSVTLSSDNFYCWGAPEGSFVNPGYVRDNQADVGGDRYVSIFPPNTHLNRDNLLEASTICDVDPTFLYAISIESISAISTFALLPAQPVAAANPVAPTNPALGIKKKMSGKSLANQIGMAVPAKAKITLKVTKSSRKICKVAKGKLIALKRGNCSVTVTVTPAKTKKIKKPKATKQSTIVTIS